MNETILLTGFEPFGPHSRNVSEEAVAKLDGITLHGFRVRTLTLPVQFERAVAQLEEALDDAPAAVIATGIHGGEGEGEAFRLEVAARNVRDYTLPDADGQVVTNTAVEPEGPEQVFSTLPVGSIKQAFAAQDLWVELSEDAGSYLCNAVFYWLARRVTPAGFLHLPPATDGLDQAVKAIELALDVTASRLSAQRVEATA